MDKNIAQNKTECNVLIHSNSKYLNKILPYPKNFIYIETNYLDKITEKEFEDMTDIPFNDFGEAIRYTMKDLSGNSKEKPKNFDDVAKIQIYKDLTSIAKKYSLMGGDFARVQNFGKKDDHPVIIDAGLSKQVFDKFYDSSSTKSSKT